MNDVLSTFVEHCRELVRERDYSELHKVIREHEVLLEQDDEIRHQHAFYQAIYLSQSQGDFVSAQKILQALIEADGVQLSIKASALNVKAVIATDQDKYSEALNIYQQSYDVSTDIGDMNGQARALINQAIIYNNHLHNLERTLTLLGQAEQLLQKAQNYRDMVRISNERGVVLMRLQRWSKAHKVLETTYRQCIEQNDDYLKAICEINFGYWEQLQGYWSEAERYYAPLLTYFEQKDTPLLQMEVLFYMSEVTQAQNQFGRSQTYLDKMLRLAQINNSYHFVALTYLGLARLAKRQQKHTQAMNYYWQAIHEIEQIRAAQDIPQVRLDFQVQWNAAYHEAAAFALQLNRVEESLKFSEHARARLLLDTLGAPLTAAHSAAPPELWQELEQLRQNLQEAYVLQIAGRLDQAGRAQLRTREARIAQIRARLHLYDQYNLPYQAPPALSIIQNLLSADALVLSYFSTENNLTVFALDKHQIRQRTLPVSIDLVKARLNREGQIRGIVPDADSKRLSLHLKVLNLLYEGLLAPITEWLAAYTTIYLVPDPELRHVPFHLLAPDHDQPCPLTTGNRRLVYLPSISILSGLPDISAVDGLLIVGYNGPNLELIEAHTQQAAKLTKGQLLYGSNAQRKTTMAAMNRSPQIYFAGHNVFRTPAPTDCGLLLSDNRLLTLLDIQRLCLSGSRVILGACQSGFVAEHGGDWLGLTSAFLQAGAAQVMGTLWPVSEVAMCLLMDRFWNALTAEDIPDLLGALRQAQAEIRTLTLDDIRQSFTLYELSPSAQSHLENQLTAIQYALPDAVNPLDHPYYWAPFVFIGS